MNNEVSPAVLEAILGSQEEETEENTEEKAVEVRRISFDGLMSAADVQLVTGLSRVTIWRLERGRGFPARVQISPGRVGWVGKEVKEWIESRPRVNLESCEIKSEENL